MNDKHYTSEPPTEAGWYWVRRGTDVLVAASIEKKPGMWTRGGFDCDAWLVVGQGIHVAYSANEFRRELVRSIEPIPTPDGVAELRDAIKRAPTGADWDNLVDDHQSKVEHIDRLCRELELQKARATKAEAERDELMHELEGRC
jgi:hypothetical protein